MSTHNKSEVSADIYALIDNLRDKNYDTAESILAKYDDTSDLLNPHFEDFFTPLALCAAGTPDGKDMEWLISHGADVNWITREYVGPLSRAIEEGNVAAVETLLKNGAQVHKESTTSQGYVLDLVDTRTQDGALSERVDEDSQQILRLLLQYGADPNERDWTDHTPLYRAVHYYDPVNRFCQAIDLIPLLLEAGADPRLGNGSGITPVDVARRNNDAETEALLLQYLQDGPEGR